MHPKSQRPANPTYDLWSVRHLLDGSVLALVYVPGYGRLRVYVDRMQATGAGIDATIRAAVEHRPLKPPPSDWRA